VPNHGRGRSTRTPAGSGRKLGQAGVVGHVVNVRGVGYRLVDRIPAVLGDPARDGELGSDTPLVTLRQVGHAA
jgi:hypothetical protein